jgi:hypothetical protein
VAIRNRPYLDQIAASPRSSQWRAAYQPVVTDWS